MWDCLDLVSRIPPKIKRQHKWLATWNVRTLLQSGKLENFKQKMLNIKLSALGIAEMKWPIDGDFSRTDYRIIHTGTIEGMPGQSGLEEVLCKELGMRIKGICTVNWKDYPRKT